MADGTGVNAFDSALGGLLDDAAMFPPGSAPMAVALSQHGVHKRAWYSSLVGPLVARMSDLADLRQVGIPAGGLSLVGACDEASLAAFAAAVVDEPGVIGVEIALGGETGAPERARRVLEVSETAFGLRADDTTSPAMFLEVPPGNEREAVLDVLAAAADAGAPVAAKLRTGGLSATAFPTEEEVVDFVKACVGRGLRFKCTAGLHSALRHRDQATGFEHHGYLNILLATAAVVDSTGQDRAMALIAETKEEAVVAEVRSYGPEALAGARRFFASFGTCSVREPVEDLVRLGLLGGTSIRRVAPGDWDVLRRLRLEAMRQNPEAFASTYAREAGLSEHEWHERIGRAPWWIAWDGEKPVGLVASFSRPEDPPGDRHVVSMWVEPASRTAGLGTQLLSVLETWALGDGATQLSLWVADGNERALRLYQRFGFELTGETAPFPSDTDKCEHYMVKQLRPQGD